MQQNQKKRIKVSLFLLLAVCFLAVGIGVMKDVWEKERTVKEHTEALEDGGKEGEKEELASQEAQEKAEWEIVLSEPETEETGGEEMEDTSPYISPIDFEELWEINEDVVAWIRIPDTRIDYPVLQGRDNEQYLHTDIEGKDSVAGAIYLDVDDEPDFSGLHNILYGHHMKNGTMFKDVVFYKEQDFFDEHQDIYIYTPEREIHLKALAALYTSADGIRRRTRFYSGRALDDYVRKMTAGAVTRAESPGPVNRLFSLITCSYEFPNARTILYAYEVEE